MGRHLVAWGDICVAWGDIWVSLHYGTTLPRCKRISGIPNREAAKRRLLWVNGSLLTTTNLGDL